MHRIDSRIERDWDLEHVLVEVPRIMLASGLQWPHDLKQGFAIEDCCQIPGFVDRFRCRPVQSMIYDHIWVTDSRRGKIHATLAVDDSMRACRKLVLQRPLVVHSIQ
jgi:hypothetical protein